MNRSKLFWSAIALTLLFIAGGCYLLWPAWSASETADLHARHDQGDISGTLAAIASHSTLTPELALLEAQCYRQLGQVDRFMQWLPRGEAAGLEAESIQLAKDLFDVQLGAFQESPARLMRSLERRGVNAQEARRVVIQGLISQGVTQAAEPLIDQWLTEMPAAAEPHYLRALAARSQSQWAASEQHLLRTIELNPNHELSCLALAEFYAQPPGVDSNKAHYLLQQATLRFPHNLEMRLRLAHINRELGELSAARNLLSTGAPTAGEQLELAEVALDAGQYAESVRLLGQAELRNPDDFQTMVDTAFALNVQGREGVSQALSERVLWGATAWALSGRTAEALHIFDYALDRVARTRRHTDLQIKRRLYPQDQAIVDELNAVLSPAYTPRYPTLAALSSGKEATPPPAKSAGADLYQAHCAVCHGVNGDGFGPAARHLYPLPRNFRAEPMRLVSASNRLATDGDLALTIREGLAGTSMPGFSSFSPEQLQSLIDVVRQWQYEGLGEQYEAVARMNEEAAVLPEREADAKRGWIAERLLPSEELFLPAQVEASLPVHPAGSISAAAQQAGAKVFRKAGCHLCHSGSTAAGEGSDSLRTDLFDSLGRSTPPRDLRHDPLRRGNSAVEIYRRLALGMPGTPHPAASDLTPEEWAKLVAYVVTLSSSGVKQQALTNFERRQKSGGFKQAQPVAK